MADLMFNGVPFVSEPTARPADRVYFFNRHVLDELMGRRPPGYVARHLARQRHYERLLRPKYKRGHRKFREIK